MQYVRETIISAGNANASINGPAIQADQLISMSVQAILSGGLSPVGVLKLQASNDAGIIPADGSAPTVTNWSDIPSATIAVSADGVFLLPKTDLCFRWVRVVYTRTSGAGAITANSMALSL